MLTLACGGGDPMPPDAWVPLPAMARPQVAFEGHERMILELTADGTILDGSTVVAEDPSALEVVEQECRGTRCGVVLRVRDVRPNMGIAVPAVIDAQNHFLRLITPAGERRAILSVRPLDTIENGSTEPVTVRGIVLAASAEASPGSIFAAMVGGAPLRWVVFGSAGLHGTIDVSLARAGGGAGGGAAEVAPGPNGGAAATGSGGGGGGGARDDGAAGATTEMPPGSGGAGGAGDGLAFASCVDAFDADESCGGGGGGGAAGAGGGGGGTLLVASLGPLDLSGAELVARGENGTDGGGGGAGGNVLLASPAMTARPGVDVSGGPGGTTTGIAIGGSGATGRARADTALGDVPGALVGPAVDVSTLPAFTSAPTILLYGRATAGAEIEIAPIEGGTSATTTADATTGAFTVEVTLVPGINRLAVRSTTAGETLRSWVGTSFELDQFPALSLALPVGAAIDVVYLP